MEADPVVAKLFESTEEGQKVTRLARFGDSKWCAVFKRIPDPFEEKKKKKRLEKEKISEDDDILYSSKNNSDNGRRLENSSSQNSSSQN